MIKRFVKMTFKSEYIEDFKTVFNSNKELLYSLYNIKHNLLNFNTIKNSY